MFGIYVYEEKNGNTVNHVRLVTTDSEVVKDIMRKYENEVAYNSNLHLHIVNDGTTIYLH